MVGYEQVVDVLPVHSEQRALSMDVSFYNELLFFFFKHCGIIKTPRTMGGNMLATRSKSLRGNYRSSKYYRST